MPQDPAGLLRSARERAGLSQRALADRAGTSQSVVARIELGTTSPTWETLTRLVAAAGFDIDAQLAIKAVMGSHMLSDVHRIRALSVEERLAEITNVERFLAEVRRI